MRQANLARAGQPHLRPLAPDDREGWGSLWRDYLAFYGTERPAQLYDLYFERLLSTEPHEFHAIVAEVEGRLVGLTHYLFHRHGWREENVCYLQDLYAVPEMRGKGLGRALIEAVYDAADRAGAPTVYWLTQTDNAEARKLYDRIGRVSDFIRYDRAIA
ncbi:MAG: GNAT family N-acetyltransferase [Pseudomonadota bacterium]